MKVASILFNLIIFCCIYFCSKASLYCIVFYIVLYIVCCITYRILIVLYCIAFSQPLPAVSLCYEGCCSQGSTILHLHLASYFNIHSACSGSRVSICILCIMHSIFYTLWRNAFCDQTSVQHQLHHVCEVSTLLYYISQRSALWNTPSRVWYQ